MINNCIHDKTIRMGTSNGLTMIQCNRCHFYGTEDAFEELLNQEYLQEDMLVAQATEGGRNI